MAHRGSPLKVSLTNMLDTHYMSCSVLHAADMAGTNQRKFLDTLYSRSEGQTCK